MASTSDERSLVVGRNTATNPRNSGSDTNLRACATNGNAASIVAALNRTPGNTSRANARIGGNARFNESNVVSA